MNYNNILYLIIYFNSELIMSGEGHKDWVSGIAFHPRGSH
jgi:hypothetical protein